MEVRGSDEPFFYPLETQATTAQTTAFLLAAPLPQEAHFTSQSESIENTLNIIQWRSRPRAALITLPQNGTRPQFLLDSERGFSLRAAPKISMPNGHQSAASITRSACCEVIAQIDVACFLRSSGSGVRGPVSGGRQSN